MVWWVDVDVGGLCMGIEILSLYRVATLARIEISNTELRRWLIGGIALSFYPRLAELKSSTTTFEL